MRRVKELRGGERLLYDKVFLKSIPDPEKSEWRSLVNIKANVPWLLENLDRWYTELFPVGNQDLVSRLRNIEDSPSFTSAFWELVIFRYLRTTSHDVLYNQTVAGKTPDLYWPKHDIVGDVISVSDPKYNERERTFIKELEKEINESDLPFDVSIVSFKFLGNSYRKKNILQWIYSQKGTSLKDLQDKTYIFDDDESMIEILIAPRTSRPTVKAVGMFELDAGKLQKSVKGRILKKLEKYQRQIIVFTSSGLGFWKLKEDILEDALYGDIQLIVSSDPKVQTVKKTRAPNGIFYNRAKAGIPANERIVAVVYVDRIIQNDKLLLKFKVYHNPYSKPRLPKEFFKNNAQLLASKETCRGLELATINQENILVEVT